ncbi:hypothetical protein [Novosphingobium sp.]|uniref:hypothetical protein n=1 Tax=Novosphingobium sp. TaxID=1874826 RepID=UPI0038BA42F3
MKKVPFDHSIDIEIRATIERAKSAVVEQLNYDMIYALDIVSYQFVINSADGLRGLDTYQRRKHVDGAQVFISQFSKGSMASWQLQYAMAEQMIDYVETYFPNYAHIMMRTYFSVARKCNENVMIRLQGIGNLAMQWFGYEPGSEVPDVKGKLFSYQDSSLMP